LEVVLCLFGVEFLLREDANVGAGIFLLVLALVLFLFVVINYNKIVRYKNKIK
jgi:hypothetical protein